MNLQGLIFSVINHCSGLSLDSFLLEFEILFEYGGETIAFKKSYFLYQVFPVVWHVFQVKQERHAIP